MDLLWILFLGIAIGIALDVTLFRKLREGDRKDAAHLTDIPEPESASEDTPTVEVISTERQPGDTESSLEDLSQEERDSYHDARPSVRTYLAVDLDQGTRVKVTLEAMETEPDESDDIGISEIEPIVVELDPSQPSAIIDLDQGIVEQRPTRPSVRDRLMTLSDLAKRYLESQPISNWRDRLNSVFSTNLLDKLTAGKGVSSLRAELLIFGLVILVYSLTRMIALEDFPIYFFTDEAVQSVLASDLIRDGFHDPEGHFLPTYFQNAALYNLSVSVYLQVIPNLLLEPSIFVTRLSSVVVTIFGGFGVGLILRNIFKLRYWWTGVLFLSITPAWFLHSRTAFETVLMVSLYVWFLYSYLLYRTREAKYLYWVILTGALVFYSYSPGQIIIVASGLLLFFSDFRYHWENRKYGLRAVGLILLAVLPYIRFQSLHGGETYFHLRMLNSYWLYEASLFDKIRQFIAYYTSALNPGYWYLPNDVDLIRHVMKGYGHITLPTLPLAITGLIITIRRFKDSQFRTLLAAMLAAPFGAAIVGIGLTRVLVFVIPAALFTALGFEAFAQWIAKRISHKVIAPITFALLAGFNVWMLTDSLKNAPTWFTDYGLYGMQYGAKQVFGEIGKNLEENPNQEIFLSPVWANGTDILERYFFPKEDNLFLLNIDGLLNEKILEIERKVFILTPEEYGRIMENPIFDQVNVLQTIQYPDGRPGFYFTQLHYVPNVEQILEEEELRRTEPVTASLEIDGELVLVEHPPLDAGRIEDIFDGDFYTLARSRESNPARLVLQFTEPRELSGMTVSVGSMFLAVQVKLYTGESADPISYEWEFPDLPPDPTVEIVFDRGPETITKLEVSIQNRNEGERAKVHIREITLH